MKILKTKDNDIVQLPTLNTAKITNRATYGHIYINTRNGNLKYTFVSYWDGIDDDYNLDNGSVDGLTDDEMEIIDEIISEYLNNI